MATAASAGAAALFYKSQTQKCSMTPCPRRGWWPSRCRAQGKIPVASIRGDHDLSRLWFITVISWLPFLD